MSRVFEKKEVMTGTVCSLSLPVVFLLLWIFGVPLKILIPVLLFACIIICSIGAYIISRKKKKFSLEH
jgi:hypothetical protein